MTSGVNLSLFLFFTSAIGIYKPPDVRPIIEAYSGKDIPIEYAKKEAEAKQRHIEEWEHSRKGLSSGGFTLSGLFGGSSQVHLPYLILPPQRKLKSSDMQSPPYSPTPHRYHQPTSSRSGTRPNCNTGRNRPILRPTRITLRGSLKKNRMRWRSRCRARSGVLPPLLWVVCLLPRLVKSKGRMRVLLLLHQTLSLRKLDLRVLGCTLEGSVL